MASPNSLDFILGAKNLAEVQLTATQQRLREMGVQVDQLNQRFRAGAIGPEVYRVQLGSLQREAGKLATQTRGLAGSELNALENILGKTSSTTGHATTSFAKLRAPLQSLALQLTATSGAAGQAVGALATLGLGTGPMILIAAGVAAIAAVHRILTKDLTAAKKGADDLTKSLKEQAQSAKSAAQVQAEAFAKLREQMELRQRAVAALGRDRSPDLGRDAELDALQGKAFELALAAGQARRAKAAQDAAEQEKARKKRAQDLIADATLEVAVLGKSAEAAYRLQLARQGLTQAEIDQLVHLRNLRTEREKLLALERQLGVNAPSRAVVTGGTVTGRGNITPGMQGAAEEPVTQGPITGVEGRAIVTPRATGLEAVAGGVASGFSEAADEARRLGEEVETLAGAGRRFGRSFGAAFEDAIAGSQNLGKSLKQASLGALADIARAQGKFYQGKALEALAGAFFPKFNPAGLFAFAKYTAAAAIMGQLAGGLSGAAGGGGGGGGGAGDSTSRDRSDTGRGTTSQDRQIINVYIVGQRTKEVIEQFTYEMARHANTGGRTPGVSAAVHIPGVVVVG